MDNEQQIKGFEGWQKDKKKQFGAGMATEKSTPRKPPELQNGIRVQYQELGGAMRAGYITKRDGNFLTIKNALNERKRIKISQVKGYWKPRVKASPSNLVRI